MSSHRTGQKTEVPFALLPLMFFSPSRLSARPSSEAMRYFSFQYLRRSFQ